jgi:hypothetical protein
MRQLHNLRSRVKAARTVVVQTLGLAETLRRDWQKAARFYAMFGITEAQFQRGVRDEGDPNEMVVGGASLAGLCC